MQKRGVKLNASRIGKDDDGFEDLDQFWDAADTNTTVRTSVASSRLSDADSLNYEDTGSISENDEDTEEEESAFTPAGRGGKGVPKGGRESTTSIRTSDDSALPFEDTPASVASISPFPTSASPVRGGFGTSAGAGGSKKSASPASGGRDGARGRAALPADGASSSSSSSSSSVGRSVGALGALNLGSGSGTGKGSKATEAAAPTYNNNDDDDDDDDYGGGAGGGDDDYGAGMMDYDEEESSAAAGSKKGGNGNRRVSFGQGTKSPVRGGGGKGNAGRGGGKGRGRGSSSRTPESSGHSNATTPESAATAGSSSATDRRSSIGSVRSMAISTPGSHEFTRGRQVPDDSFVDGEDDEEEEEEDDTDGDEDSQIDRSFIEKLKKRKPQVEEDDEDDDEEGGGGSRRSKRATKGKSFQWWKGERVVYDQGQMIGVLTANPTPAKPKTKKPQQRPKTSAGAKGHKSKGSKSHGDDGDEEAEFDFDGASAGASKITKSKPPKIPKELASQLIPREVGDELQVWDDGTDAARTLKVVCYTESLHPPSALPITAERPPGKDGVGYAAQSFNIPEIAGVMSGWISGFVELPAGAIKDAEGVGECAQVFFMSDCQDEAVELGIADPSEPEWRDPVAQRQLLKKGDSFYVPPGNIYRLENHSSSKAATVHWCIIKPLDQSAAGAGGGMAMNQDQ